jgi:hypothetical protein
VLLAVRVVVGISPHAPNRPPSVCVPRLPDVRALSSPPVLSVQPVVYDDLVPDSDARTSTRLIVLAPPASGSVFARASLRHGVCQLSHGVGSASKLAACQ